MVFSLWILKINTETGNYSPKEATPWVKDTNEAVKSSLLNLRVFMGCYLWITYISLVNTNIRIG